MHDGDERRASIMVATNFTGKVNQIIRKMKEILSDLEVLKAQVEIIIQREASGKDDLKNLKQLMNEIDKIKDRIDKL